MMIELTQKGQDNHQGVGYLSDGTMVVVEQSNKYIGQTVQVEVVRSLQTAAGKMMFARRVERQTPKKAETPAMVAAKTKSLGRSRKNENSENAKPKRTESQPQQQKPQQPQKQQQPQNRPTQKSVNQQKPRAVYHAARKRINHEDSLLQLVDNQKDD
jgi:hypothetical protein